MGKGSVLGKPQRVLLGYTVSTKGSLEHPCGIHTELGPPSYSVVPGSTVQTCSRDGRPPLCTGPAGSSSCNLSGFARTITGPWATLQTGNKHLEPNRRSPEAGQEKSSREGSRAERSDKLSLRKIETTV